MSLSRDELADRYLSSLLYQPYRVQEEALLAWFSSEQGVLVCTPTGTGKTLIAEAALFEALHNGSTAYYTTPLIALCEQKFYEMQAAAVRWGFRAEDVGLVTGNRRENPRARVLVVVAEILLNRLLHTEAFDFNQVSTVVMDEFHSFNDPERGIVWELTLGLLPSHVRLLLLSATVGNAMEFLLWLRNAHQRNLELIQGDERRVPLSFHWVGDMLLNEQIEVMARGDEQARFTPALVFCFNREECWNIAEQLKGKRLLSDGQQKQLAAALERYEWSQGAGLKLKQLLLRGIGVHHAGVLPKYRRIVEGLFQQKLLTVAVCTETLSAGINLPARSVVLPSIMKGPPEKKKLLDSSTAHQIFGRAGRPQYDVRGHVFVLAHEDDVKLARWREKYDQIPEDTKDPVLLKAKKALKRKMPTRRAGEQYWTEAQFRKLAAAPPAKLASRGQLPWRLLAYMLDASPEVESIRRLVSKRLMDSARIVAAQKQLEEMLLTLWRAGYVELEPPPPKSTELAVLQAAAAEKAQAEKRREFVFEFAEQAKTPPEAVVYRPVIARPTETLPKLLMFRGVNPLYAVFLLNHLGIADCDERLQALESVLELPRTLSRFVRVPDHRELPPGPLATLRLDPQLLRLGLASPEELYPPDEEEEATTRRRRSYDEPQRRHPLTLAEKLRRLFDYDFFGVHDLRTTPVWAAGELQRFGWDFNKYVAAKGLQKQEGVIFRHLLRLILLLNEFTQLTPPETTEAQWREDLSELVVRLSESCRRVDPTSTDKALEELEMEND